MAAGLRSLHRNQNCCKLPLPQNVEAAAQRLFRELEGFSNQGPGGTRTKAPTSPASVAATPVGLTSIIAALQDYFFLSVTSSVDAARDEKFACPVQAYLACFGYNEDDTFKTAPEVTSLLASWQFLLRCTALHEAVTRSKEKKVDSALT